MPQQHDKATNCTTVAQFWLSSNAHNCNIDNSDNSIALAQMTSRSSLGSLSISIAFSLDICGIWTCFSFYWAHVATTKSCCSDYLAHLAFVSHPVLLYPTTTGSEGYHVFTLLSASQLVRQSCFIEILHSVAIDLLSSHIES